MVWHAGLMPGVGALLQMVPARDFAVIVLANRSEALLNETAEKAMELMLPLGPKAEAKSEQALAISTAEIREYVGAYTNRPESAELLLKQGRLVLKRGNGELPVTKIGDHRFSIGKPTESEAEEFVLDLHTDQTIPTRRMRRSVPCALLRVAATSRARSLAPARM